MLRGDCSYGSEGLMSEAESRGVSYLLKLRKSEKVKSLMHRMKSHEARWKDAGDGWEVIESKLKLNGWSQERRIVLVRPKPRLELKDSNAPLPSSEEWEVTSVPWEGKIAVLVTSLNQIAYPLESIARLYRERADAENIYDELKNQWGWCGFTTRAIAPSRLMANLIALVYNWWSLYARLYDSQHHREAVTSRPALLHGVARLLRHAGQSTIKVSLQHENSDLLIQAITKVSSMLQRINVIAEQWNPQERWAYLLTLIFGHWLGGKYLARIFHTES
jgi:Transposase DDE domain group 1